MAGAGAGAQLAAQLLFGFVRLAIKTKQKANENATVKYMNGDKVVAGNEYRLEFSFFRANNGLKPFRLTIKFEGDDAFQNDAKDFFYENDFAYVNKNIEVFKHNKAINEQILILEEEEGDLAELTRLEKLKKSYNAVNAKWAKQSTRRCREGENVERRLRELQRKRIKLLNLLHADPPPPQLPHNPDYEGRIEHLEAEIDTLNMLQGQVRDNDFGIEGEGEERREDYSANDVNHFLLKQFVESSELDTLKFLLFDQVLHSKKGCCSCMSCLACCGCCKSAFATDNFKEIALRFQEDLHQRGWRFADNVENLYDVTLTVTSSLTYKQPAKIELFKEIAERSDVSLETIVKVTETLTINTINSVIAILDARKKDELDKLKSEIELEKQRTELHDLQAASNPLRLPLGGGV